MLGTLFSRFTPRRVPRADAPKGSRQPRTFVNIDPPPFAHAGDTARAYARPTHVFDFHGALMRLTNRKLEKLGP